MTALNAAFAFALLVPGAPPAIDRPVDVRDCVAKGLKWLVEQQKEEGNWAGRADSQPTTTTAMAGLALLMEGSTLKHGTYAPNLRKAVEWMLKNAQSDGLLSSLHRTEANQPVATHAQALLFLACAYDLDDDPTRREQLGKLLAKAVTYARIAQTTRGGWASSIGRADDTVSTISMLHGLHAARSAGIEVPRKITDRAAAYLVTALGASGPRVGDDEFRGGVPVRLTAGGAAALLISEGHRPPALAHWVRKLISTPIPLWPARASTLNMSTHLHLSRVAYSLGEHGYRQFDPDSKPGDSLRWSTYREVVFPSIKAAQGADGSWVETVPGPVYGSAVALVILQLDNDFLPAFSR